MPTATTILIDSNIFDQHAYHFTCRQIAKLTDLAKIKKLKLLLPDALEREIIRHIKEKSAHAQSVLKKARREAHFLPKWSAWPKDEKIENSKIEIEAAALREWQSFLENFKVVKLGYDDVDMRQVMDWYDQKKAPFGDGAKQKEFPDAFIVASAVAYAKRHRAKIAIVSNDGDIRKFCEGRTDLNFFHDLPTFIENIIAATKAQIDSIKAVLAAHPAKLIKAIEDDFLDRMFYPEEDPDGEVMDVSVKSVQLSDLRLLDLDETCCTISFSAEVTFSAYVSYDDPDTMVVDSSEDFRMALHRRAGTVTETADVLGMATVEFDENWENVADIADLDMKKGELVVKTRPPIDYDEPEMEWMPDSD